MKNKKIKIFLGAYLNYINAQNLNCLALAKYLDSNKYDIYALKINVTKDVKIKDVKTNAVLFKCFKPLKISTTLAIIFGIITCQIIYLPKHKIVHSFLIVFANLLGKKVFTTIENNMCDTDKESMLLSFGGEIKLKNHFRFTRNIFGITKFIINNATCGVQLNNNPLYLGVDIDLYKFNQKVNLKNIVFIGNLKKRKRVDEFIRISNYFNNINFYIIGSGEDLFSLKKKAGQNVHFLGQLNHDKLSQKIQKMDLLFLPSKSEGFPKVILEVAACGIPSMVYSDYGADEWIIHMYNGFIIENFEDAVNNIKKLQTDNILLQKTSQGAFEMAKRFDWKIIIKEWDKVINNLK